MSQFIPRCLLVTGGAGFIGSNFIRWVLEDIPEVLVVNLDLLTYAGNLESLADVIERHGPAGDGRYYFLRGDVRDFDTVALILRGEAHETAADNGAARRIPSPDGAVHLAGESHVDRSIMGPAVFVDTNVRGTLCLLEAWRAELTARPRDVRFVHVSTDEVYGTLASADPPWTEATPLAPNSPYAASKASADLLVRASVETFKIPALITRSSNNYGPYQFPEKLIPLMITRALADEPLPVYGDGMHRRSWLHVEDHAAGLWAVLNRGRVGDVYNIGGSTECPNLEVVHAVLRLLAKPQSLVRHVTDRPGHDRRYAMDSTKIMSELGWRPARGFEDGLAQTVAWYVDHPRWWQRVLSEAYRASNTLYLASSACG